MIGYFIIGLLTLLVIYRLIFPWEFVDGNPYNIFGINKYGETMDERSKRFDEQIDKIKKDF